MRHARGTTIEEVESQLLTKLVMNTADGHFDEHKMKDSPFGQRLVFGLITGSTVIGLATQDTAENALAELSLDKMRFRAHRSFSAIRSPPTPRCSTPATPTSDDAGIVRFKHWGVKQDGTIVFEGEREVLIKRRSHWVSS